MKKIGRWLLATVCLTAVAWGQGGSPGVWPASGSDSPGQVWNWWLDLGMHIQAVDRPERPEAGEAEFYRRFRDYDDVTKHSQRPSYLQFQISRGFGNGWSIVSQTQINPNWLQMERTVRYPRRIKDLDSHTNIRGFVEKVGKGYAVKVGRDFLMWDPGRTGTLLSNNLPSFDQLRFDAWNGKWTYHAFVGDVNRRDVLGSIDRYKYLVGHRFEVAPTKSVVLWLSEIQIITRPLSLSEVNPLLLIYHNLERIHRTHNAITSVGMHGTFKWGVKLFFQFDMDEIESRTFEDYTSNQNALAFQGGLKRGMLQLTYTRTWPWLYNHEAKTEQYSTTFVFTESQDRGGARYFDRFMGFPVGSGARVLDASINPFRSLTLAYRSLRRTPNHILETISALDREPVETRNRVTLVYRKTWSGGLRTLFVLGWEQVENYHHDNLSATLTEVLLGISYRFSGAN